MSRHRTGGHCRKPPDTFRAVRPSNTIKDTTIAKSLNNKRRRAHSNCRIEVLQCRWCPVASHFDSLTVFPSFKFSIYPLDSNEHGQAHGN